MSGLLLPLFSGRVLRMLLLLTLGAGTLGVATRDGGEPPAQPARAGDPPAQRPRCAADAPRYFGPQSRRAWCDIKRTISEFAESSDAVFHEWITRRGNGQDDGMNCEAMQRDLARLEAATGRRISQRIEQLLLRHGTTLNRSERGFWRQARALANDDRRLLYWLQERMREIGSRPLRHTELWRCTPEQAVGAYLAAQGLKLHYIGACASASRDDYRFRGRSYCTADAPPEMVRADFPTLQLDAPERLLAFGDFRSDVWAYGFFQLAPGDGGWEVRALWGNGDLLPRPTLPAGDGPSRLPSLPVG
jgi:hypothetical protein